MEQLGQLIVVAGQQAVREALPWEEEQTKDKEEQKATNHKKDGDEEKHDDRGLAGQME